jgi:hypothetical protein
VLANRDPSGGQRDKLDPMRSVAPAAVFCAILGGCHEGTREMRCKNRVDVDADIAVVAPRLNGATIAVCRNDDCVRTEARMIAPTNSTLWSVTAPADVQSRFGHGLVVITTAKASSTQVHAGIYPVGPNDRDIWRMAVVDESGTTLFDVSRSALHVREDGTCRSPNWSADLTPTLTASIVP